MDSRSKELATQQLRLRFYDLEANILSDSSAYIHLFAQLYRRFRADGCSSPPQASFESAMLTRPDNPWGKPVMTLDGEVWTLDDPRLPEKYIHIVLHAILTRVRSHLLIHAGVVSWEGQGIILIADSAHGKTTLVLELVRRGSKFLSDDMAALGRADRHVQPFPKSIRTWPGTLELAGFPEVSAGAPSVLGKLFLDIEDIKPGSMGESATVSHIVILRDPAEAGRDVFASPEQELIVCVDRLDEAFLAAVRQIEGVAEVRTNVVDGHPFLMLHAARRNWVLSQIEALCQARKVRFLGATHRPGRRPTFESPARLEAIPTSQAVIELLRRLRGGIGLSFKQDERGGSSTRLFMELAAIIGQASCYQLFVGPLNETADLVCGLVST